MSTNNTTNNTENNIANTIETLNVNMDNIVTDLNGKADKDLGNLSEAGYARLGGSLKMFDTVVKDHVLSFEESVGLAPQGTWVYKNGVTGSRYGYPAFYEKCLEESGLGSKTLVINTGDYLQMYGSLTIDDGIVSGFTQTGNWMLLNVLTADTVELPWEIGTKVSGIDTTNGTLIFCGGGTGTLNRSTLSLYCAPGGNTFSFGVVEKVGSRDDDIRLINGSGSHVLQENTDYWIKICWTGSVYTLDISTDGINYENDVTLTPITSGYYHKTGGLVFGGGGPRAGYVSGSGNPPNSIDLKETYFNSNGERLFTAATLEESGPTETITENPNGHKYYDVSHKAEIDTIFEQTGSAWFYGIDTENERIFLPRKTVRVLVEKKEPTTDDPTWYNLYSDGWCEQGGHTAVTSNGSDRQQVTLPRAFRDTSYTVVSSMNTSDTNQGSYTPSVQKVSGASFICVYNGTIIPVSQTWFASGYTNEISNNANLCIVVGTTITTSAPTAITEITSSENDTIPLFTSMYLSHLAASPAWLKSEGQWNSGNLYETAYNELVNALSLNTRELSVKRISESYDDYDFVVDEENMAFRLPLLNGSEDLPDYNQFTDLGILEANTPFVAPCNGLLLSNTNIDGSSIGTLYINGKAIVTGDTDNDDIGISILLQKGDVFTANGRLSTTATPRFIPCKGNGSLYFKVSNAVQNLEVLNAGNITEALAVKTDMAQAAHAALPSGRWIDLTLGANGSTYTALGDGYFAFTGSINSQNNVVFSLSNGLHFAKTAINYSHFCAPCKKGDVLTIGWSATSANIGTWSDCTFRFIYAEGSY